MARVYMTITKKSVISGKNNTMRLKIDPKDMVKFNSGTHVQKAFPYLTAVEREFLIMGTSSEEQEKIFGNKE